MRIVYLSASSSLSRIPLLSVESEVVWFVVGAVSIEVDVGLGIVDISEHWADIGTVVWDVTFWLDDFGNNWSISSEIGKDAASFSSISSNEEAVLASLSSSFLKSSDCKVCAEPAV